MDDTNMDLDSEISSACSDIEDADDEDDDDEEEEEEEEVDCPLHNMSSLLLQLPFKRGLSKHYQGKSQSFVSISKVSCLEELAKQENPYNKKLKLKSCRSYGGFLSDAVHDSHISNHKNKTSSMGSYSSSLITTSNRSSPTKITVNTSSTSTDKTATFHLVSIN